MTPLHSEPKGKSQRSRYLEDLNPTAFISIQILKELADLAPTTHSTCLPLQKEWVSEPFLKSDPCHLISLQI